MKKPRRTDSTQQPDALLGRRVMINEDNGVKPGQTGTIVRATATGEYEVDFGGEGSTFYYAMSEFIVLGDGADARQLPAGHFVDADPHLVAFSLNNPRKRRGRGLDIESLNSLAASIKAQGLAQPILVRPLPGNRTEDTYTDREPGKPLPIYELVCGERRLRASRLAGLATMPMLVRELTDEQALELQLVENIEREDLDPMEEAEGFALLKEKLGYSVEQIAERIGRGRGKWYVHKAMRLLALTPESREAMYDGHLGRSTGLLVAQYAAPMQAEVVEFIKAMARNGEPAPFREVAPQVRRQFNLVLKLAPWPLDDAALVADAGACSTCPKRTGSQAEIFGDASGEDSCTDAGCFDGKRQAHLERLKAEAAAAGLKVLDEAETKTALQYAYGPKPSLQGYVRLTDTAYIEKGDDDVDRAVTFEDALRKMGKKAPKPRVLVNPNTGTAEKVITRELAEKLAPDDEAKKRPAEPPVDDRPEEQKALDDWQVERAVVLRIFDIIRSTKERKTEELRLAVKHLVVGSDDLALLERYLGWEDDIVGAGYDNACAIVAEKIDAMLPQELGDVLAMAAIELAFSGNYAQQATDAKKAELAAAYGIDILAVRDKVAEDLTKEDQDDDAAGDEPEDEEEGAEA